MADANNTSNTDTSVDKSVDALQRKPRKVGVPHVSKVKKPKNDALELLMNRKPVSKDIRSDIQIKIRSNSSIPDLETLVEQYLASTQLQQQQQAQYQAQYQTAPPTPQYQQPYAQPYPQTPKDFQRISQTTFPTTSPAPTTAYPTLTSYLASQNQHGGVPNYNPQYIPQQPSALNQLLSWFQL